MGNAVVSVTDDPLGNPFTAESFLQALRLSNSIWWEPGEHTSNWVFRGQSDSNWRLIPSAWRNPEEGNPLHSLIIELDNLPLKKVISKKMQQENIHEIDETHPIFTWINAELEALYQFADLGNRLGLDVEPMLQSPRKHKHRYTGELLFCPDQPNIGLAQHHGIPTRYLDFSLDPVMAAYHAVSSLSSNRAAADIAVWALHRNAQAVFSIPTTNFAYHTLLFVDTAAHKNPFLKAQSGLFLKIIFGEQYFYRHKRWPDLESLLNPLPMDEPVLMKYVLKSAHVLEFRELLRREGFSKPKLMPTLDNVAMEVLQNWK